MSKENLELWSKVEKTNPKYTKKAKVGGNNITAISPQFQIMNATEKFGPYGIKWGFRNIEIDYSITNIPIKLSVTDFNTKKVMEIDTILGLVGFKATFFYPDGSFEITNSIKIFTDNKHSKIDDNYAKKLETDALTKALSKLGFNADIFLGKFDDVRYVEEMEKEFAEPIKKKVLTDKQFDGLCSDKAELKHITTALKMYDMSEAQRKVLTLKKADLEKSK
jgi:hypothetical protein